MAELVEIKYPAGQLTIDPEAFFGSATKVTVFRKLVKLSIKSDTDYGTNAIETWRTALNQQFELLKLVCTESEYKRKIKKKLEKYKEILEGYAVQKCENCYHNKICIDGVDYKAAQKCRNYKGEALIAELTLKERDTNA